MSKTYFVVNLEIAVCNHMADAVSGRYVKTQRLHLFRGGGRGSRWREKSRCGIPRRSRNASDGECLTAYLFFGVVVGVCGGMRNRGVVFPGGRGTRTRGECLTAYLLATHVEVWYSALT